MHSADVQRMNSLDLAIEQSSTFLHPLPGSKEPPRALKPDRCGVREGRMETKPAEPPTTTVNPGWNAGLTSSRSVDEAKRILILRSNLYLGYFNVQSGRYYLSMARSGHKRHPSFKAQLWNLSTPNHTSFPPTPAPPPKTSRRRRPQRSSARRRPRRRRRGRPARTTMEMAT